MRTNRLLPTLGVVLILALTAAYMYTDVTAYFYRYPNAPWWTYLMWSARR